MSEEENRDIANRCVAALRGQPDPDFAELFAPEFPSGHIYDPVRIFSKGPKTAANWSNTDRFTAVVSDYDGCVDLQCFVGSSGFVIARTMTGTLADQTKVHILNCTLFNVEDGRIVAMQRYQDAGQVAPLAEAMERHAKSTG